MADLFRRYRVAMRPAKFTPKHPLQMMFAAQRILETQQPDVTICDWSLDFWFALQAWRPPRRVSVLRCEQLLGYERRTPALADKFGYENQAQTSWVNNLLRLAGLAPVADCRELFRADVIVVPSIPAIDPLPARAHEYYPDASFVYTGPLLLPIGEPMSQPLRDWAESRRQAGVPILLVTLGTVWGAGTYEVLADCLTQTEHAVLMIVPDEPTRGRLEQRSGPRFHVTGLTDLQQLVEVSDVVLHHSGHGTLHAALLAGKPSVTVSSGEYDREDMALRLEELGCGRHLGGTVFEKGLDSRTLIDAIRSVSGDGSVRTKVAEMSRSVSGYVEREGAAAMVRALSSR